MSTKQKRKLGVQCLLFIVGLIGFLLMINSIGAVEGDYIIISTQLSLNVRSCVTGFSVMCMAIYLFKSLFRD